MSLFNYLLGLSIKNKMWLVAIFSIIVELILIIPNFQLIQNSGTQVEQQITTVEKELTHLEDLQSRQGVVSDLMKSVLTIHHGITLIADEEEGWNRERLQEVVKEFTAARERLNTMWPPNGNRDKLDELLENVQIIINMGMEYDPQEEGGREALLNGMNLMMVDLMHSLNGVNAIYRDYMEKEIEGVSKAIIGGVKQAQDMVSKLGHTSLQGMLFQFVVVLFLIILMAVILTWILRRLDTIQIVFREVKAGRITARVPVARWHDEITEISDGVNETLMELTKLIREIRIHVAGTLPPVSKEFADAVDRLNGAVGLVFTAITKADQANENLSLKISDNVKAATEWIVQALEEISKSAATQAEAAGHVAESADEGSYRSSRLSTAIDEMVGNVDSVSNSINKISGLMGDMHKTIRENATSQKQVLAFSESAVREAGEAANQVEETQTVMSSLAESANEIGKAVSSIKNIAKQTNMLALNASIEAAGAGEAGKGFAVVANEVKELAKQTEQATNMISQRVEEIQSGTKDATSRVMQTVEVVNMLAETNRHVGDMAQEQSARVDDVNQAVQGVASATNDVAHNLNSLSTKAQEVANTVAELSESAQALSNTATAMSHNAQGAREQSSKANEHAQQVLISVGMAIAATELMDNEMGHVTHGLGNLQITTQTINLFIGVLGEVETKLNHAQQAFNLGPEKLKMSLIKGALLAWLSKLELHACGQIKLEDGGDPRHSPLGEWLYHPETGSRLSHLPVYKEVEQSNRKLHELVSAAIVQLNQKKKEAAKTTLAQLHDERRKLFTALDNLYHASVDEAKR
ncbi:methyl-accepting chemotaxis sensory transducer [Magnetococcus marinus MC-1]|uniref:Methyl-accepting chemotaxis sensory transducer n=1 Tax=Magnetococcus marinus (strain ATCC BAA-1437 / JCM 17883 / MC-1) TaxID=156889 RepID=A0L4S3_MAGMM|nr:HAMP domain-containing methyl-accepting chemotaxis protein [Magnetococcus marinus]ABK42966.1 methyl-accepting chemotaxis sensory transducer [Magnetococcus marinus MC-1]